MTSFTLPSFAKINLNLRVLGKRPDGFHELFTVFQTVSLHDSLSFSENEDIRLTCDDTSIPTDQRNLVVKAANLLRERGGIKHGVSLHLEKRIPAPGGLGGGSSNAAVALIGLSRLWKLELSADELQTMACELGSDVPYFLTGGTAIGSGRGTQIEPIEDLQVPHLLIVSPYVSVSTPDAFKSLDARNLTTSDAERILIVCRFEARKLDILHSVLTNDMEPAVFAAYPEIERVKHTLLRLGAVGAMMSGSGASVFAVFDKEETRQTALKALGNEANWRKFAVTAVSRTEYREKVSNKL